MTTLSALAPSPFWSSLTPSSTSATPAVTQAATSALVVIDTRVEAIATLRSHLVAGVMVIEINASLINASLINASLNESSNGLDGLTEIHRVLNHNPALRELHLISHGRPGCIEFGSIGISRETLATNTAQVEMLSAIGDQIDQLVIYGCNVAAGDAGAEFLATLSRVMGCAITASTTKTGHRDRGGDWNFEANLGMVGDGTPAIEIFKPTIATYPGVFAADNYSGAIEDIVLTKDAITGLLANDGGASNVIGLFDSSGGFVGISSGASGTAATTQGGSVTVKSDGSFTYRAPSNYKTTFNDSFDYTNILGVRSTVTFSGVIGVNDPPTSTNISFSVAEDTGSSLPLATFDAAFSDVDTTDQDAKVQAIEIVSLPTLGLLDYTGGGGIAIGDVIPRAALNTLVFKPLTNSTASQTFTFKVRDGSAVASTSPATATLNITRSSDPPVAVDDTAQTQPNTSVLINVTANDADPDGDSFDIFVSGSQTTSNKGGSIGFTSTKTLTYAPAQGFVGVDTFTYSITDGNSRDSATVTVTVNSTPGANDDFAIATDGLASEIFPLANDTDANGSDTVTWASTLPLNTEKGGRITLADGATQRYVYTAPSNFTGADRVTYTVKDQFDAADTAVININVANTNNDIVKTRMNTHVLFTPLANDSQFEPLSFVSFETVGRNDGIISVEKDNTLRYTPPTNFEGEDYIFYTATDSLGNKDTALVTFVVSRLFDDPNVDPTIPVPNPEDLLTGAEGSSITIAALPTAVANTTVSTRAVTSDAGGTAVGDVSNNSVVGLNGNDILVGFEGDDNLVGGSGNDQLFGNAGNDYNEGNSGDDLAFGGQGNDYILGDAGNDLLSGEDNEDIISGGDGNDFLFGNRGLDRMDGGRGNDSMFGGQNDDTLTGSFGDDVISGERGNDTIQGGNENDALFGNGENDLLDGSSGDDTLYGGQNEDILYGGTGNDLLLGEVGKDDLKGDAGNDTLTGGLGEDTLTGGAGVDQFTVAKDDAIDIITDFVPGTDKLFFPTLTRDLISVIDRGGNTLVQEFSTDTTLVVLTGITASTISVGDLVF